MLAFLVLAPLAWSLPEAPAHREGGSDTVPVTRAVELRTEGRDGPAWQAGFGLSRPPDRLFAAIQPSPKPPAVSPGNPRAAREVICGLVVITGPEVDPKIRIPIPRRDVKFAIGVVPPLGCHRER